ncbi:VanZ family protein [Mumia xiangluensis]|uniref:VanZ family protein n=1 Tax=Mumia xiangluensis TaxID=1678900 RepID=A0ABW1QJH3_9ACTN
MSEPSPPSIAPSRGVIINGPGPGDWIGRYESVALVMLTVLPLAALVVWGLARRRRRAGSPTAPAWRTSLAEVGIVAGTLPWVWLTLLPASHGAAHGGVSEVPIRDLLGMPPYQIVGNLLVFAALGFLAPVRFAALASIPRILALAAAGSILIESAQYAMQLGRVSSVDDVLLNTAGAGLAAVASRRWWRVRPDCQPSCSNRDTMIPSGPRT